jgi:hypothetical protein
VPASRPAAMTTADAPKTGFVQFASVPEKSSRTGVVGNAI